MTNGTGPASVDTADVPEPSDGQDSTDQRVAGRLRRPAGRRPTSRLSLLVGVLGLLAAIAVPLAPVTANDTVVSWPMAGRPAESTLAFFVPYEPASVSVDVPCHVIRGLPADRPTTLVSSDLPGAPSKGFAVTAGSGQVLVLVGGVELLRAPVAGDCSVALRVDTAGSTARIGEHTGASEKRVEQINAFSTELAPADAAGIQVVAKTANWFENTPTLAKRILMALQVLLATLALVLLARTDRRLRGRAHAEVPGNAPSSTRGQRSADRRASLLSRARHVGAKRIRTGGLRALVDAAVLAVFGGWWVLGPVTPDDSFAAMTVRNGLRIGDIGNYYRWENASEAPFTLVQRLLQPVAEIDPTPLAMRLPSVLAGLLTWVLLSRVLLPVVLPEHARRPPVRALAAVSFLAWWLPFGLGVRPESFAALGITAAVACTVRGAARGSLLWLGFGALAAGLSIAVNAMGIVTIAALIVLAVPIWRLVRDPGPTGGSARTTAAGRIALLLCLGSTGLVAIFADQTLAGAREATRLHRYYGPDVPWFQEILRYQYLLGFNLEGDIARRTPVLLSIVLVIVAALLFSRGARRLPGMDLAHVPAACLAISLVLLSLTPSKWTHYFGALAGVGAATLTAGVVLILLVARHWAESRTVLALGLLGIALTALAAAVSFAGKNNWFFYSHFGVPWGEQPVWPLDRPMLWLALAGVLVATAAAVGRTDRQPARRMLLRVPAVISVLSVGVTVTIVLVSFVIAPLRQADSYSVGGHHLASLSEPTCGIADHIVVTPERSSRELRPLGADAMDGFTPDAVPADPAPPADRAWSSLAAGPLGTGGLTSGWFELPHLPRSQELAISVAGRSGDGNRIALEFGEATSDGVHTLGERVLQDTEEDPDERPVYPTDHVIEDEPQDNPAWRSLQVAAADIPHGADRVRVRAADGTTDSGGWLAVSAPRIRDVIPLPEYLADHESILVDWSMTWNFPCVRDFPSVGGGLAEPPDVLITPPESFGFGGSAAYSRDIGGSFAGVPETGTTREIPTRLLGVEDKPEYREWGHLKLVEYPISKNRYDVRSVPAWRWGWRGE